MPARLAKTVVDTGGSARNHAPNTYDPSSADHKHLHHIVRQLGMFARTWRNADCNTSKPTIENFAKTNNLHVCGLGGRTETHSIYIYIYIFVQDLYVYIYIYILTRSSEYCPTFLFDHGPHSLTRCDSCWTGQIFGRIL